MIRFGRAPMISGFEQRTYHGNLTPQDLANGLLAQFNHSELRAVQHGQGETIVVQIGSSHSRSSGGPTALTVYLSQVEDGVHVRLGEQEWLGVAASLGQTALMALLRPISLLGRLDDIAQDLLSFTMAQRVIESLDRTSRTLGASFEISERLRRLTCPYCATANPVGNPNCLACGGPLGYEHPISCANCGFISEAGTEVCPECGSRLTG